MRKSTTSWLLPDVNVWLAMHARRHKFHTASEAWFDRLDEGCVLVFCRQTQLGFFRLLTNPAIMADETLTQRQCWAIYDEWLGSGRAVLQPEPAEINATLRARTSAGQPATKTWMDSYLAAFAEAGNLTLVTFDTALASKTKGAVLLS